MDSKDYGREVDRLKRAAQKQHKRNNSARNNPVRDNTSYNVDGVHNHAYPVYSVGIVDANRTWFSYVLIARKNSKFSVALAAALWMGVVFNLISIVLHPLHIGMLAITLCALCSMALGVTYIAVAQGKRLDTRKLS